MYHKVVIGEQAKAESETPDVLNGPTRWATRVVGPVVSLL